MTVVRFVRIVLWSFIAASAVILVLAWSDLLPLPQPVPPSPITRVEIGGPFVMTSHNGQTFTEKDLQGRPFAVFFGFTHCPDICPTALAEISALLQQLGRDADRLRVLFVTVDPARDSSQVLADYLAPFDARITGLSGSLEQLGAMAKLYQAHFRKAPTKDGDYAMDHSAVTYLMRPDGTFFSTLDPHESLDARRMKIRRLLDLPS